MSNAQIGGCAAGSSAIKSLAERQLGPSANSGPAIHKRFKAADTVSFVALSVNAPQEKKWIGLSLIPPYEQRPALASARRSEQDRRYADADWGDPRVSRRLKTGPLRLWQPVEFVDQMPQLPVTAATAVAARRSLPAARRWNSLMSPTHGLWRHRE